MSVKEEQEDWEELDLEESGDAVSIDVDMPEKMSDEPISSGPYGCYCH